MVRPTHRLWLPHECKDKEGTGDTRGYCCIEFELIFADPFGEYLQDGAPKATVIARYPLLLLLRDAAHAVLVKQATITRTTNPSDDRDTRDDRKRSTTLSTTDTLADTTMSIPSKKVR
jgi:hypothetical protein